MSLTCNLFKHTLHRSSSVGFLFPKLKQGLHPAILKRVFSNHTHSLTSIQSGFLGNADSF